MRGGVAGSDPLLGDRLGLLSRLDNLLVQVVDVFPLLVDSVSEVTVNQINNHNIIFH